MSCVSDDLLLLNTILYITILYALCCLGDAAHAMTTHAGRGANTAFQDAMLLSRDILGNPTPSLTLVGSMLSSYHSCIVVGVA